jgi:hypothetical protein
LFTAKAFFRIAHDRGEKITPEENEDALVKEFAKAKLLTNLLLLFYEDCRQNNIDVYSGQLLQLPMYLQTLI